MFKALATVLTMAMAWSPMLAHAAHDPQRAVAAQQNSPAPSAVNQRWKVAQSAQLGASVPQAGNSLAQSLPPQAFSYTIVAPWYDSVWAIPLWLVLLLTVLAILPTALLAWQVRRQGVLLRSSEAAVDERRAADSKGAQMRHKYDYLGALPNTPSRQRLEAYLQSAWKHCADHRRSVSLLLIDVDNFGAFNAQNGRDAGDALLEKLAKRMRPCLRRADDLLARLDGDRYLAVLPGAQLELAVQVAEQMRDAIAQSEIGVCVSVAVASENPGPDSSSSHCWSSAEMALFRAKRDGGDRVVAAETRDASSPAA